MSHTNLDELNFEAINDVYQMLMGENTVLAICSISGELIWTSGEEFDSEIQNFILHSNDNNVLNPALTGLQQLCLDDSKRLYYKTVSTSLAGPFCYLLVLTHEGQNAIYALVDMALKSIGALIETQYDLAQELNEMAQELIDRHEELNLLYSLDEHINQYDCIEGISTLKNIIKDCMNFLSVEAVFLNLPEDGIDEINTATDCFLNLPNLNNDWARIKSNLLIRLKSLRRPIIINSVADNEFCKIKMHSPMKLASVPIFDGKKEIVGMLAVVTGPESSRITNSDRKLLEVMSKQISIIIQSDYDSLTGLLNRQGFEKRLLTSQNNEDHNVVLFVDVDQYNVVTDSCGRISGEELLKQIGNIIERTTRDSDSVGRITGSEFSILLEKCPSDVALNVGKKIIEAIQSVKYTWENKQFDLTACVGLVSMEAGVKDINDLINVAHSSCLVAKNIGPGEIYTYNKEDPAFVNYHDRIEWLALIQKALRNNDFKLYAQPIITISDKSNIPHFEVLLRLIDEQNNLIPPFRFIGPAEDYKMMPKIDRWVIENTLEKLSELPLKYYPNGVVCSINLSGQSFSDSGLFEFIESKCKKYQIPPQWICFEVTETAAISNFSDAVTLIHRFKDRGFSFALDDFGTGLSSFSYLNNLPVDYLKIDGEFVKDIHVNEVHLTMVSAINKIGHVMGLKTIAEFVENQEIVNRIAEIGIDFGQGYGLGKPIPLDELLLELRQDTQIRAVCAR